VEVPSWLPAGAPPWARAALSQQKAAERRRRRRRKQQRRQRARRARRAKAAVARQAKEPRNRTHQSPTRLRRATIRSRKAASQVAAAIKRR